MSMGRVVMKRKIATKCWAGACEVVLKRWTDDVLANYSQNHLLYGCKRNNELPYKKSSQTPFFLVCFLLFKYVRARKK